MSDGIRWSQGEEKARGHNLGTITDPEMKECGTPQVGPLLALLIPNLYVRKRGKTSVE